MSYIQEEEGKANWIGHSLHRKFLLKHVLEGKRVERIDVNRRRGRKRKQQLNDVKEKRGYWKWREEMQFELAGELEVKDALDLSEGRQCGQLSCVLYCASGMGGRQLPEGHVMSHVTVNMLIMYCCCQTVRHSLLYKQAGQHQHADETGSLFSKQNWQN